MARRLTCQLYSNVAWKNWKLSTFCVSLFWKQICGLMECWRAHSHAKIHWQAKQYIESHGAREREFNFSTSFQTANVPCSSERKIRLSICSTHTVSKHEKSMLQSRYWNTQSVRQIILNIVIIIYYCWSNREGEQYFKIAYKDSEMTIRDGKQPRKAEAGLK